MIRPIIFLALSLSLVSCKDFFEKNIEQEQIEIISPKNGYVSSDLNVYFTWSDIQGAITYKLLIASPSFDTASNLYIDTSTNSSPLMISLSPGDYQWKVRAENNSSFTDFSPIQSFKIDSSYDLNNQSLVLYLPSDNKYSNNPFPYFLWQDLYAAENYTFKLKRGLDWQTSTIILDTLITSSDLTLPFALTEDTYIWSVEAQNNLPSHTGYSHFFHYLLDLTSPATPLLNSPTINTPNLFSDSLFLFDWTRAPNNGNIQSPLFDSLYIYSDTTQIAIRKHVINQEDSLLPLPSTSGVYYWNVQTFDKAGNNSVFSSFKSFIVN